jgi:2-polyprenyl-6-hydroxyphenyl methylase/3-demethylubiquinone-9 3-methyltransferase
MKTMAESHYEFGRNWERFVSRCFTSERVSIAGAHMLEFLGVDCLEGQYFLDIGCGSGIHSLAALRAGARRIVSFDLDPVSVATTQRLRELAGSPESWTAFQGSVLDRQLISSLEPPDIVYSWGVLHHTGAMWQAIANAAELLRPGALIYLALYSADMHVNPPQEYWLAVKQRYNQAGALRRRAMEIWYVWRHIMNRNPVALPGLIRTILTYKLSRGMSFLTDAKDWLGGWPMEFAKDRDVLKYFMEERGCILENLRTGSGNTEFLFRQKPEAR